MVTATTAGSELRAGRREWIGLAVLALPAMLLSVDLSVLYLALPHLAADLGANSSQQLWIMDIYGFMLAGFLVTMGTLGDRIGRRRLLLIGAAMFGIASILAAYSTSPGMLIATRALLGVAGATLAPSGLALITNMFTNPKQRGVAIAVWMSGLLGGFAFGPVVGGVVLQYFWWGAAFLIGVPVMLMLMTAGPALLPEYRDHHAGRLDLASVTLSLATILPIIYALKELAKGGWGTLPVAVGVIGLAFGVMFVRRQRRLADPLLDLRLFGSRAFSGALSVMLLTGAIQGGALLLANMYLQSVKGLSPLSAGLWLLPTALAMVVSLTLAPALAQRIRPAYLVATGLTFSAVGYLIMGQLDASSAVGLLVLALGIVMVGLGPQVALLTDILVGSAPPKKAGSAAAISETSGEFGIALGIATLGSIGTAVYRSEMADVPLGDVPADAADAARQSLATAVAAAEQLPGPTGAEMLAAAQDAFTSGLNTAAIAGAVLFVALALLTIATLRHVRQTGSEQAEQAEK